jgi:uncharacterized protein
VIVISDTSAILNLAIIGQLDLLRRLYDKVVIPSAVLKEIKNTKAPDAIPLELPAWIEVKSVDNTSLVVALSTELDDGESEAICLAVELAADLLLLDERLARQVASRFHLRYIGLLGVLIEAKRKSIVPGIRPLLDDIVNKAGFWISPALYAQVLKTAGE